MFEIGDKVIWLSRQILREGTVTMVGGRDCVWVDNQHKPEDCLYASFAWPDLPETREHAQRILDTRERQRKEDDELMKATFELNNKLIREGKR